MQSVDRDLAMQQQCIDGQENWEIASGIEPLKSIAAIEWTGTLPSSIITTTHRNHTVAFVGTTDGELVKVLGQKVTFNNHGQMQSESINIVADCPE